MYHAYGKQSHLSAIASALRLREQLIKHTRYHTIDQAVFCADALDPTALQNRLGDVSADIVFADIPYGMHSRWQIADSSIQNPISQMLGNMLHVLAEGAIVAVAADKSVKVTHPLLKRVERFQSGKRQIVLLKPVQ